MNPNGKPVAAIPGATALILILCAALLLGGSPAAPAVYSSAAGNSGWKTYRSKRFGFRFQYPPGSSVVDGGPYTSQSGTQPESLDALQIRGEGHRLEIDISVYKPGIVRGDYDWPERPCGEWTFGPDGGPLSSERMRFAGQKTLHVIARNFRGGHSAETNNYYCVNNPRNPVVIVVLGHPPSPETRRILASFRFFKPSQ